MNNNNNYHMKFREDVIRCNWNSWSRIQGRERRKAYGPSLDGSGTVACGKWGRGRAMGQLKGAVQCGVRREAQVEAGPGPVESGDRSEQEKNLMELWLTAWVCCHSLNSGGREEIDYLFVFTGPHSWYETGKSPLRSIKTAAWNYHSETWSVMWTLNFLEAVNIT